jgi:hypothetical protein
MSVCEVVIMHVHAQLPSPLEGPEASVIAVQAASIRIKLGCSSKFT